MLWVLAFLGLSAAVGGYASYSANRAAIPELTHRPGTPVEVVQECRNEVINVARPHAVQSGATLVRVDATSAGPMRRTRSGRAAPVEVGVVYERNGAWEGRKSIVECRIGRSGHVLIAPLPGAARQAGPSGPAPGAPG